MGSISLQIPVIGQPASTEDPKIASNFGVIQAAINGNLDSTNLSASAGITGSQLAATAAIVPAQLNLATWGTTFATPSRSMGAAYTPNTTRPTMVYASLFYSNSGFPTASINIKDSSGTLQATIGPINPVAGATVAEFMHVFLCPANYSYTFVQGSATVTVSRVLEQTL